MAAIKDIHPADHTPWFNDSVGRMQDLEATMDQQNNLGAGQRGIVDTPLAGPDVTGKGGQQATKASEEAPADPLGAFNPQPIPKTGADPLAAFNPQPVPDAKEKSYESPATETVESRKAQLELQDLDTKVKDARNDPNSHWYSGLGTDPVSTAVLKSQKEIWGAVDARIDAEKDAIADLDGAKKIFRLTADAFLVPADVTGTLITAAIDAAYREASKTLTTAAQAVGGDKLEAAVGAATEYGPIHGVMAGIPGGGFGFKETAFDVKRQARISGGT